MSIAFTPDSFLLGECDTHFGTIQADILAQLACPEGYEYPSKESAEVDSVCLYLYFREWHGDGNAPIGITVYEMDRQTIQSQQQSTNILLSDYCSLADSTAIAEHSHIVIPAKVTDSVYSNKYKNYVSYIPIKLSDEFARRFFQIKTFPTQADFNEQFKGLYICSDFGGSTILYIIDIHMSVFYHFTMQRPGVSDSIIHDVKSFYANNEVHQVNRYTYPHRKEILEHYSQVIDTNYIVSPANIYTSLEVRIDSIYQRIEEQLGDSHNYRVYVNKATVNIDVLTSDSSSSRPRDKWDTPAPYMLLIEQSKHEEFFAKNELPNDTTAILASLAATTDSLNNVSYSYTYDLSKAITQQIRKEENRNNVLSFMLVPVAATTNSSGSITAIKQLQTISTTRIRSAQNTNTPITLEMVYSGFNLTR
jgi:hypothetical protein